MNNITEAALIHPSRTCIASPTGAHHYIRITDSGIFRCKYCWTPCWFPTELSVALKYSTAVNSKGLATAYKGALAKIPKTVETIRYLLSVQHLRGKKVSEAEVMKIVNKLSGAKKPEHIATTRVVVRETVGGLSYYEQ